MAHLDILNHPIVKSLLRITTGGLLAFALYQLALNFATSDCRTIQINMRDEGLWMIARLIFCATLAAILGAPSALIAVVAGILTGPIVGAPLTSLAISAGSLVMWAVGHFIFRGGRLPEFAEGSIESANWYQRMMRDRAISGFNWTAVHGLTAPIPYPYFGLLVGAKVRHLTPQSFLAGIFAGSILNVAGYTLAGASIGCAVVNHASGYEVSQYRALMVVSCLILILLSRLQSSIERNLPA